MILNKSKIYAKVWKAELTENGKYMDLQISTSEKQEETKYVNSGWFPRAIGHALNSLKSVKKGDKIEITSSKFTNEYKEVDGVKKGFFRFIIFEAKIVGSENKETPQPTQQPNRSEDPF